MTTTHDTLHILDDATRLATVRRGDPLPEDPMPPIVYLLSDHLGSSTTATDHGGVILNREEYSPYGETTFGSYTHKRYRFTAKERDEESDLYYNGARYYAPWLARWVSLDPLPAPPASPYRYGGNNPLRMVDPSGTQEQQVRPPGASPTPSVSGTSGAAAEPLAAGSGEGAVASGMQGYAPEPLPGAGSAGGEAAAAARAAGAAAEETVAATLLETLGVVVMALPLLFMSSDEGPPRHRDVDPLKAPGTSESLMRLPGLPPGPRLELPPYAQTVFNMPGSPTKMPILEPILPPSPMELSRARDFGNALDRMVNEIQKKGHYGDWYLWKQNERLPGDPLVRPDEVWINTKTREFFIADRYAGGKP